MPASLTGDALEFENGAIVNLGSVVKVEPHRKPNFVLIDDKAYDLGVARVSDIPTVQDRLDEAGGVVDYEVIDDQL